MCWGSMAVMSTQAGNVGFLVVGAKQLSLVIVCYPLQHQEAATAPLLLQIAGGDFVCCAEQQPIGQSLFGGC